jgi:hypothetical protein
MYTSAQRDDIRANVELNVKKPVFNQYGRYWFVKHTDTETGRDTESRFRSLAEANCFYEEIYRMFEANYISYKFRHQHGKRR